MSDYYKEGFLIQIILYALLWLSNDYIGLLLCLIMTAIVSGLLVFALMAEWIQRSKVPRSYFKWMFVSALAPMLVMIAFITIYGRPSWM